MKKWGLAIVIFFILISSIEAKQRKKVKKEFTVQPGENIEINTVSGMDVNVVTWDKNIVKFDLEVSVSSSDNDYEKKYISKFDIREDKRADGLEINFYEFDDSPNWSFWDIFKFEFGYYVDEEITGKIYLPKSNPLDVDFRYGKIDLVGLEGSFNLNGRSNELYLENCKNIESIENHYGEVTIKKCAGDLDLSTRSTEVQILGFKGPAKIDAQYSEIVLKDIEGKVLIDSRSSDRIAVSSIGSDLTIRSDYSTMLVSDVEGFVIIKNRSGNIDVENVLGINVSAPYTECNIKNVISPKDEKLLFELRSGSLRLEDVVGDVEVDDNYSNLSFKKIAGNVKLKSRSSDIDANGVKGNWIAETQYCSYKLFKMNSPIIKIKNRSDDILIEAISVPNEVMIKNEYGGVNITMPEGFQGHIGLYANYGEIDSDIPLRYKSVGSSATAVGNVGSGTGSIEIETRSENIKLKEKMIP